MQTVEPGHQNNKTRSYIFIWLFPQKAQKTPYDILASLQPGVAEHRIAESPGLK